MKKVVGIDSLSGGRDKKVEAFCDYFGLQMALPVEKIKHIVEVDADIIASTMSRYNLGHFAVMHQFMENGTLPKKLLFDTSIGGSGYPLRANKIDQRIICYDCHINEPHEQATFPLQIDAFDLTKYDWMLTTPFIGCRTDNFLNLRNFRLLNISHGRWSENDDRLMEEKLKEKGAD